MRLHPHSDRAFITYFSKKTTTKLSAEIDAWVETGICKLRMIPGTKDQQDDDTRWLNRESLDRVSAWHPG